MPPKRTTAATTTSSSKDQAGPSFDSEEQCCECRSDFPPHAPNQTRSVSWIACCRPSCLHWVHLKYCTPSSVNKKTQGFLCTTAQLNLRLLCQCFVVVCFLFGFQSFSVFISVFKFQVKVLFHIGNFVFTFLNQILDDYSVDLL